MWDESADTHMAFIDKTRKTSRPVHPVPIAGTWVVDRGAVTVWLSCANAGACPAVDNRAVRNLHLDSGGRVVSDLERRVFASYGTEGWGLELVGVGRWTLASCLLEHSIFRFRVRVPRDNPKCARTGDNPKVCSYDLYFIWLETALSQYKSLGIQTW